MWPRHHLFITCIHLANKVRALLIRGHCPHSLRILEQVHRSHLKMQWQHCNGNVYGFKSSFFDIFFFFIVFLEWFHMNFRFFSISLSKVNNKVLYVPNGSNLWDRHMRYHILMIVNKLQLSICSIFFSFLIYGNQYVLLSCD